MSNSRSDRAVVESLLFDLELNWSAEAFETFITGVRNLPAAIQAEAIQHAVGIDSEKAKDAGIDRDSWLCGIDGGFDRER